MIQVRRGVFETNSSSTHSITFANKSEFDNWKNGEVYFNDCWFCDFSDKTWMTKEEAVDAIVSCRYKPTQNPYQMDDETLNRFLADEYNIYTYDIYFSGCNYNYYKSDYTTDGGEDIVAFGYYGHC